MTHDSTRTLWLVYDQQCPVCELYCRNVHIRESAGKLHIVDARNPSTIIDEITHAGLDIDQGMVLKTDDRLYYGEEAIHILALSSSRKGIFNRINYILFRSTKVAKTLYPVLRACRNLLLKALRRTRINNLGITGNDYF